MFSGTSVQYGTVFQLMNPLDMSVVRKSRTDPLLGFAFVVHPYCGFEHISPSVARIHPRGNSFSSLTQPTSHSIVVIFLAVPCRKADMPCPDHRVVQTAHLQ